MPLITIDGRPIEVEPGTLVIQAADRLGVEIPRFCYHPDLRPEGNCRMCLVEVQGFPRLTVACATAVIDGMVVRTAHTGALAEEAARGALEFLLVNHPLDCPICDQAGECSLQDYYMHPHYGLHDSHVDPSEKMRKRKKIELGPRIVLDSERCVMCSRCVRFSAEVTGTAELQFVRRGNQVELKAFEDRALQDEYAGNLADLCPVGALTSHDFRFKRRVWHLSHTDSVCAGCSTGCNVRLDHFAGRIERVVPRRNPQINRSWMCDEGRLSFHTVQSGRLERPRVHGDEVQWSRALEEADAVLRQGPGRLGALGSASATNETLLLLRRYVQRNFRGALLDFRLADEHFAVDDAEDALLRRRDKHPNTRGALLLGLGDEPGGGLSALLAAARAQQVQTLLLLYCRPLVHEEREEVQTQLDELLSVVGRSVVLTTHVERFIDRAQVVLPIAAWSEEEGTYTNHDGVVQAVEAAITPPVAARPAVQVLADLLALNGRRPVSAVPAKLFTELVMEVPAYEGLDYGALVSRAASVYPPEGRLSFGKEGFAGY